MVTRYDMCRDGADWRMGKDRDGDYVTHADHLAELAKKDASYASLEASYKVIGSGFKAATRQIIDQEDRIKSLEAENARYEAALRRIVNSSNPQDSSWIARRALKED